MASDEKVLANAVEKHCLLTCIWSQQFCRNHLEGGSDAWLLNAGLEGMEGRVPFS